MGDYLSLLWDLSQNTAITCKKEVKCEDICDLRPVIAGIVLSKGDKDDIEAILRVAEALEDEK